MKILAIETSCDETAAAVVEDGTKILSNVVASSTAMHEKYGGIVPEVAAREQLKCIIPIITEALSGIDLRKNIDAVAVTIGPGLIGSLLVGVETAKTIAFVTCKPIIPVNHVLAHMYANFLDSNRENSSRANVSRVKSRESRDNLIEFPAISLVVSGGHTELYLMKSIKDLTWLGGTLDDAAGECFDKTARLLGFGHGGGVAIAAAAAKFPISPAERDPASRDNFQFPIKFPRPMINDESLNFSFSGLKTAVMREWKKREDHSEKLVNTFAHEIQESITDVLVEKTLRAAKHYGAKSILLSGGVAANTRLREKFSVYRLPFTVAAPEVRLCTDNAVMIAAAAALFNGTPTDWHSITAQPDLSVEV